MAKAKRVKVPFPTKEEMADIVTRNHEVTGFSAYNHGPLLFLKLACDNGDIAMVSMSAIVADYMLRHLQIVLQGAESSPDSGSRTNWAKTDFQATYGSLFQAT